MILRDPTYQLKQSDIVTQVRDGYIIKKDGTYYLYLTDPQHTLNVRSVEEIAQQKKGELVSASKENAQNLGKLVISVSRVRPYVKGKQ